MCHYTHLTLNEREKILFYRAKNYSISKISEILNRNKSTIARELKRNSDGEMYLPSEAQKNYQDRRKRSVRKRILEDEELFELVKDKFLNEQWSPEQISGRLAYENGKSVISYNTIYRGIYAGLFNEKHLSHGNRGAIRKLRHKGKSRHTRDYEERRGKIRISNEISQRPAAANNREQKGHWEADTVVGRKGKACLVTLVDRKTRFLAGGKAEAKKAKEVKEVIIAKLKDKPHESITPDRGKEFAKHDEVTRELDEVQFYFPLPHHPWERGSNENTNGLLREYVPKGFDIDMLNDDDIEKIYDKLNKRPRKCLGYKTPFEEFYSETLHLT